MNSHLTIKHLKHSTNFESVENVRSLHVVEFEFELCHIPSPGPIALSVTLWLVVYY